MFARFLLCLFLLSVYGKRVKRTEPECQCVPQHLCLDNDVGVNGQGLLDVRFETKPCTNYFDICCENAIQPQPSITPPVEFKGCGVQSGMEFRITGDSEKTRFAELPWSLVLLYLEKETQRHMYKCGASLIHPQVALTAAHCIASLDFQQLTVRAGEWNTKSREEPIPHQDLHVKEALMHPGFHSGSLRNDIAILFLVESAILADNVGVVCLPPASHKFIDNTKCIASGWGKDAFKKGSHSSVLKKIELPIVGREGCVRDLRNTRLGAFYKLHRSFICAGGEVNKDTCKGDGGSPLVCSVPEFGHKYVQAGIVSWGIGCGELNTPGVYVNVALYRGWIDREVGNRGLDISYYNINGIEAAT